MTPSIGVAVTTYGRPQTLINTLAKFREHTPTDIPIVVVDDGTVPPCPVANYRFDENRGIAAAKNKSLELLDLLGVEHLFLFDSDTYPIVDQWWQPYVDSPEPHLMHQFPSGPAHWNIHEIFRDDHLVAYDKPRGCMLYVHRRVLDVVGGMHVAWGKHGGEHGDWSDRIHAAGLTRHRYADHAGPPTVHCLDQDGKQTSSVNWRQHQHWKTVDATQLPVYAEYREQPVPVLIPRRADHGWRDQVWKHLHTTQWDRLPGYRVVEGHHDDGLFNRSAAINSAARDAGNWDVCVIADADTWVPRAQLDAAVATARQTGRLTAAFTSVVELSEQFTTAIIGGTAEWAEFGIDKIRTEPLVTQSSMLAVPRILFDRAGGFDEAFQGWGGEDGAFWCAATVLAGVPERVDGHAFHLWHEPAPDKQNRMHDAAWRANNARWQQYVRARTERDLARLR